MSDTIERVRQSMSYAVNAPAEQIYADLESLREFDRENEKLEARWGWVGCGGILGIVGGIIAFIVLSDGGMAAIGLVLLGVGVAATIVGFVVKSRCGRYNLDDVRYEMLNEVVRLLDADMGDRQPFQVHVDFSAHNAKDHFQGKGKAGHWDVKYFLHAWFRLEGQLLDGSKFTLAMSEKQQDRHRWKTNARGKTKSKSKTKNGGEAMVSLRVKEKRYPRFAERRELLAESVQLPPGVLLKSVTAENFCLNVKVKFNSPAFYSEEADPKAAARARAQLIATMMLSCYQVLNQSRASREA